MANNGGEYPLEVELKVVWSSKKEDSGKSVKVQPFFYSFENQFETERLRSDINTNENDKHSPENELKESEVPKFDLNLERSTLEIKSPVEEEEEKPEPLSSSSSSSSSKVKIDKNSISKPVPGLLFGLQAPPSQRLPISPVKLNEWYLTGGPPDFRVSTSSVDLSLNSERNDHQQDNSHSRSHSAILKLKNKLRKEEEELKAALAAEIEKSNAFESKLMKWSRED